MTKNKQADNTLASQLASDAAESTLALNPVVGVNPEELIAAVRTTALQGIRQPLILTKHVAGYGRKLVDSLSGEKPYSANRKGSSLSASGLAGKPLF